MKLWSTGRLTVRCGAPSKEVDRLEERASWSLYSGDLRTGAVGAASACVRQTRLNEVVGHQLGCADREVS